VNLVRNSLLCVAEDSVVAVDVLGRVARNGVSLES
jgi:hypothetical protein